MSKLSELPADTAPASSDLIPFVDVTAARTEHVTVADLAASSSFTGSYAHLGVTVVTGTTHTLALADALVGALLFTNSSPVTLTVPANADVAFPVGSRIDVIQGNTGQLEAAAALGVTVNTAQTLLTRTQYSPMSFVKVDTDSWILAGDLA